MGRESLKDARRVVVKAGTRTLLDHGKKLDLPVIERLLGEIVELRASGRNVIFVSSGAIGAGLAPLGLAERPHAIPDLQAAAAVGQSLLMEAYNRILSRHGLSAAQLLVTHGDFQHRRRYLNFRNVLTALEKQPVLPVINENDTVSVDEIRFGDNDLLAGMVANAVDAEVTILLSDVDGFRVDGKTQDVVAELNGIHEAAAGGTKGLGSGGMVTKLRAAKIVTAAGGCLALAHGKKHRLRDILDGKPVGTLFLQHGNRLDHHERWIAHTLKDAGSVTVDTGGAQALLARGKSLLAVGITACDGDFDAGDAVMVREAGGRAIAKGLVNYPAQDLRKIMGRRTEEFESILGYRSFDEIVHRDNMVVLHP